MPFVNRHTALALVVFSGCAAPPAREASALAADPPLPVVEVVRVVPYAGIGSDSFARQHYTDVRATISGSFTRPWDGSTGRYKVPLRLIYPDFCTSSAVVESLHPNYIGKPVEKWRHFRVPGQNDPDFDPLFDLTFNEAFSEFGARGLFGRPPEGSHVYAGLAMDNLVQGFDGLTVLEHIAAVPENQPLGLHLDRPTDLSFVYAGVSRWLREHPELDFEGKKGPCAVDDVVLFGYSYTSGLARAFLWNGLNTELARGGRRVFDGAVLAGEGPFCLDLRSDVRTFIPCPGATPPDQGPVISVRSDTDFELGGTSEILGGPEDKHYVVHQIAGSAHVDEHEYSLKEFAEFLEVDVPIRQNTVDRRPVLRAELRNLLRWVDHGVPPPPSTLIGGEYLADLQIGIVALDAITGNTVGGVQLPALAAPLGLYRGTECHGARDLDGANPYLWAEPPLGSGDLQSRQGNYLLEPSSGAFGLYCFDAGTDTFFASPYFDSYELIAGVFLPYTSIPGSRHCAQLYPTRRAYTDRVARSAAELVSAGFLLERDVDDVIAAAEAAAHEHPGCVPEL